MIRLNHITGSLAGSTTEFDKRSLRVGTSADCDIRYDLDKDAEVGRYHAAIVLKENAYHVLDLGQAGGVWVNGEQVTSQALRSGDRIRFGGEGGPEAEVGIVFDPNYDAAKDAARMVETFKGKTRETKAIQIVRAAAERVAEARARAGGTKSRHTMEFMATTIHEVGDLMRSQTRKRWVKIVGLVAAIAAVVIGIQGLIIDRQQRQIATLLDAKGRFDAQIKQIQDEMAQERDSLKLVALEHQLQATTARAEQTLADLARRDKAKAEAAVESGDELDREIRAILRQFEAGTYAVPPIFKERVAYHLEQLRRAGPTARLIYRRKVRYWPQISAEFTALELPEVMAYVAWTESQFDPMAKSSAGARGMWQMTRTTAQGLGLRVDGTVDERTDVSLQTRAAVRYLAGLMAEFGEESFMLAMASYNKGENGVRRVLRKVAMTPGGYKRAKRDFWHLYRLKLLPEETREYVPKILAAAIACSNPEKYGLVLGVPPRDSLAIATAASPAPSAPKASPATGR
ncbi:MAG TPA: transglycosylase SLT domain-containing protein [Gemmatimonadales bacterium]|nr:transglycosylase SLT domain-containing protein [Gemmatimonadales bacterium]